MPVRPYIRAEVLNPNNNFVIKRSFHYGVATKPLAIQRAIRFVWSYLGRDVNPWPHIKIPRGES